MSNQLILHAGGYSVDRQQVYESATPRPEKSWHPIAHNLLLERVEGSLVDAGWSLKSECHGLACDGNRYFGLLEVEHPGYDGDDHGLVVGLRNSHDRSFSASIALGSRVFVCDNLSFSGEVKIARKHTSGILRDLQRLVNASVGQLADLRQWQRERFDRYKSTELGDRDASHTLIQSVKAGVLPVTRIKDALTEWDAPRHREFAEGGKTAWRLFNAVTESIKGRTEPLRLQTPALHGIFDQLCGYVRGVLDAGELGVIDAEVSGQFATAG